MNKCRQRKEKEKLLNIEHHEAYVSYQNSPSQENLTALNVMKEKLEKLYEEKFEGIIVRSRARWHEHGEKNSKYLFNLEKRNHVKKHIRKLRLSGVITTDPFEILDAEKAFYESSYKSRQDPSQQNEFSFSYEELPIPTLSEECKQLDEGTVSLEECTKVLNSFPLREVPGNYGLPVEFYKTFWGSVGQILVECFNESFAKGEMSPSHRQADKF